MTSTTSDIPPIGFGTWPLTGPEARTAVETALDVGFRHIDTAQMYENEAEVGKALAGAGVPRGELFVVTKVMPDCFGDGTVLHSVERSLEKLQLDSVDLLLVHWPPPDVSTEATIDQLVEARDRGLCTRIGVSNFNLPMLERAAAHSPAPLATNQVEFHPLLDQSRLLAAADRLGIRLTAYCPLARGQALRDPVIRDIAGRLDRTPAQVVIRWIVQQGVAAISMSTKRTNMAANLDALAFELSEPDMAAISARTAAGIRLVNPENTAPDWDA